MPRRAVCPECGATTTVPDDFPGRQVPCAQCSTPVAVPGGPPAAADQAEDPGFDIIEEAPAAETSSDRPPVGRRSRRDEDGADDDDRPRRRYDEDDEDDDRPRRSSRRRDDDDEDDEDEDERPRRSARARDDDEEDDEDDRPRRDRARDRDDEDDEDEDRPRRAAARRRDDEEDEDDSAVRSRSRARDRDEDDDDEDKAEADEDRPRSRADDDDDEDDEDEDEEGGRKKKFKPAVGGWDDEDAGDEEDDEEDDRPRRKPESKSPLLLILGLLAFLVVGAGGGAAAYFLFWEDDEADRLLADIDRIDQGTPDGLPPKDKGDTRPPKPVDPKPKDTKPKDPKPKDTRPVGPKPVDPKPKDTKPVDPKPADPKPVDTRPKEEPKKGPPPPPELRLVNPVAARLPITPAGLADPRADVPLPGPVRDVCVGGGGRFLIFHCPTARKLAVFDVSAGKVTRTITVTADDVLMAASMEKLAVIYPDLKAIIRYSLADFRPETDTILDVRQRPTAAGMGSATAGPLILGGIPAQGNASRMSLAFLDLDTLTEVPIARAEGEFKVTFGAAAHLRVSADGRTLGAWFAQLQPSGLQTARLDGNTIRGAYLGETVGHVTPGPDGQTVYTEKGLFSADTRPLGRKEPAVPAVHGGGFLTVADIPPGEQGKLPTGARRVSVWEPGRDAPVAKFDGLPGFDGPRDAFERNVAPLALDKRLFLVPEAGVLVVVPPPADKLHVYKLDAGKGEPKKGGG